MAQTVVRLGIPPTELSPGFQIVVRSVGKSCADASVEADRKPRHSKTERTDDLHTKTSPLVVADEVAARATENAGVWTLFATDGIP